MAKTVMLTKFERKKFKAMRGSFTYASSTVIKTMVHEDYAPSRFKMKTGARKSDPMPYRVHLVWDCGTSKEQWVPLSYYRHLQSAYKAVNKQREHHINQRMTRKNLRTPTFFIEFRKSKLIRMLELTPSYSLDQHWISTYTEGNKVTPWFGPSGYVLMPSSLCPGKTISGTPRRHKKDCRCGGTKACKANHVAHATKSKHVRIPLPYV